MLENHYTTLRSRTPIIDLDQGTFTLLLTIKLDYCPREDSGFGRAWGLPADTTTRKGRGAKECPIDT